MFLGIYFNNYHYPLEYEKDLKNIDNPTSLMEDFLNIVGKGGFNIVSNISNNKKFNAMAGF